MTHEVFATSGYLAMPAELYEFRYGNDPADIVRLTAADQDLVLGGETYTSVAIKRDKYDEDGNPDDGRQLNIRLAMDNPFADVYRATEFDTAVTFKLRAVDLNDPDLQIIGLYSGRMTGVKWENPWMVVSVERMTTTLKRSGLRSRYQRQCRHALYYGQCQLDKADFVVPGVVASLTSSTVLEIPEAAAFDDGWFTGGILQLGTSLRYIIAHSGSTIEINRSLLELAELDAVNLYPGCDRLAITCATKFNNIENYGGFDFGPAKGPFEGNSLV